jgi:DNA-binding MarR family transcriptional regulator
VRTNAADPAAATRLSKLIRARRARDRYLGRSLFSDPAWDILLEAYAAHLAGRPVSVTALCDAAAVPTTTGLRWLRKLEEDELLVREADARDKRRSWMRLSAAAAEAMRNYFLAVDGTFPI